MTAAETAERDAIRAAADRLLDGTPLRSTGALTIVQLAAEAGVKRWLLTHKHRDLAELFQARARLLAGDPPPIATLKKKISELEDDNARLKAADAERQTLTEFYAHIVNELSAELDRITTERDELLNNVRSISLAPSRRARD
jgi:transposase-like protein